MLRTAMFFLNSHTSFLDDRSQPHDSPTSHLALDRLRDEASSSRDVELRLTVPYFPCGLARSENITDFNFDLSLYDSLQLPYGLFPGDLFREVELSPRRHAGIIAQGSWHRKRNSADNKSQVLTTQSEGEENCQRKPCFIRLAVPWE